jgi:hypothetical protein
MWYQEIIKNGLWRPQMIKSALEETRLSLPKRAAAKMESQ